ncbi:hypothetical protein XBKB1_1840001 [Xenorhabdus bovienii str. kraussei Becker Underwood]|uniref:Uncharacterized protein n=1 Tax=Xenorhabdus bovienii str. kraussei Becker Underwood TaxID=1398204 RepID=A0A077PGU9_XENBV|nr:hypothetical protein XBKB1_1840001 [Xenorhabdus bovienii str. kraussei Becker Underwood]
MKADFYFYYNLNKLLLVRLIRIKFLTIVNYKLIKRDLCQIYPM